jgi:hypothetical protein
MELVELGTFEMTYLTLERLDYGAAGGQLYGTMEGSLTGDRLSGTFELTNTAPRRPDNINLPTVRGLLRTEDATIFVEFDGIATIREGDGARVFVTSVRFRTGDAGYERWNDVLGVLEGVLDTVGVGGKSHGRIFECRPTVT